MNQHSIVSTRAIMVMLALIAFAPAQASGQAQAALTNDDVIRMVQAKLGDGVIIAKIKSSQCRFDTSTDALINLNAAGVSDAVMQAMTEAGVTHDPPGKKASPHPALPAAFGFYIVDDQEIRNLAATNVETKMGLLAGGAANIGDGIAVDGLAGEPPLTIHSSTPVIVVYQQNVDVNTLRLSDLVHVATMKAYEFNMLKTKPAFFRNVYGRDYNDTIDIGLWRPKTEIAFRIEPVEGRSGMYRLIPNSALQPGRYALYQEGEVHLENMIFATHVGRHAQAFYFAVRSSAVAAVSEPTSSGHGTGSSTPASCADYDSCVKDSNNALMEKEWRLADALAALQKASTLDPSRPGAFFGIGQVNLFMERYSEALPMFDKALKLGGFVAFSVCREGGRRCDIGDFYLTAKEISFVESGNKKVFTAAPSQVESLGAERAQTATHRGVRPFVRFKLRIQGKNYGFVFQPDRIACTSTNPPTCDEPGLTQQGVVANYIAQTIPKLAEGAFSQSEGRVAVPRAAEASGKTSFSPPLAAGLRTATEAKGRQTTRMFAFSDTSGSALLISSGQEDMPKDVSLLDAAICPTSGVLSVLFDRFQKAGPNDNGRDTHYNFDQSAGYRFRIVQGKVEAGASCLLVNRAFLEGKQLLSTKELRPPGQCDPQTISQLAANQKRGVLSCRQIARLGSDMDLLVIEFERHGNDLLAGLTLKAPGQLIVHELPAKLDEESGTGWRVGDGGELQNSLFTPLFALREDSTGTVELGIEWAAEEGLSLMFLRSSGGILEQVYQASRYTAPL